MKIPSTEDKINRGYCTDRGGGKTGTENKIRTLKHKSPWGLYRVLWIYNVHIEYSSANQAPLIQFHWSQWQVLNRLNQAVTNLSGF